MKKLLIILLVLFAMSAFGQITTKNVVPNTNNTGWIGVTNKMWQGIWANTGKFNYIFGNGAGITNVPAGTGAVSSVTLLSSNANLIIVSNGITGYVTNWLSVVGSSLDTNAVLVLSSNMAVALDIGVLQSATNYANTILQSATNYSDSKDILILQASTNYANTILQSATNYTDSKIILVLQSATNYANTILQSATNYADAQDIFILQASTNYANTILQSATNYANTILQSATNYADAQDIFILQSSTNYANTILQAATNFSITMSNGAVAAASKIGTNIVYSALKYTNLYGLTGLQPDATWNWVTNSGSGFDTVVEPGANYIRVSYDGNISAYSSVDLNGGLYWISLTASLPTNSFAKVYQGAEVIHEFTNNPTTPYTASWSNLVFLHGTNNLWYNLDHGDPDDAGYVTLTFDTANCYKILNYAAVSGGYLTNAAIDRAFATNLTAVGVLTASNVTAVSGNSLHIVGNVGINTNTTQVGTNVPAVLTVAGTNTPVLFAVSHGGASGASNIFTVSARGRTTNNGSFYNSELSAASQGFFSGQFYGYNFSGVSGQIISPGNGKISINQVTNIYFGDYLNLSTNWPKFEIFGTTNGIEFRPSIRLQTISNSLPADLIVQGNIYATNPVAGNLTISNLTFMKPRWIDEKISGLLLGSGINAPSKQLVYGNISGYEFTVAPALDDADFAVQLAHGLAHSNMYFTNMYINPHIHISARAAGLGAGESNVTFFLEFQIAAVNGDYGASTILVGEKTITATNTHYLLDFGFYTNNALYGADSVVIRGNLKRTNSATGTVTGVIVDSVDIHVPIDQIGSSGIFGD